MSEKNAYYPLWGKYLRIIGLQMKNALNGEREIALFKTEFDVFSSRKIANYSFNLEMVRAKVSNNVKGIPVARDLYEKLVEDVKIKELLIANDYKISMGKDYLLKIRLLNPIAKVETPVIEEIETTEPIAVAEPVELDAEVESV
ncbi:MAG: hypothetical protein Q8M15_13530 [Bacteroidota bacterium]|nr:hypothetical protein [Bacteroidota bacterium]